MTESLFLFNPTETIENIPCFHPEKMGDYTGYAKQSFELTRKIESESFWVESRNRVFTALIRKIGKKTKTNGPIRLVEIGSCTGNFLSQLNLENFELIGSDIYIDGLVAAKESSPSITWLQFDPEKMPFSSNIDMVAAFDVIEHIDNDEEVLKQAYSVLKPGGHLIVSVPQYQFMFSNLDILLKHKRRYSETELLSKIKKAGFTIEYHTSFVFFLFPLMLMSRLLDRFRKTDQVDLGKETQFSKPLNFIFSKIMRLDEWLIRMSLYLPFGGTLIAIAKKD